jgi:hypothetical protein
VPPSEWSEIDTTAALPVPAMGAGGTSGTVTVLGPITWHPVTGAVPPQYPAQHGCLVAVIDSPQDPRPVIFPSLSSLSTGWTAFYNIIGANNNIAFRNFNTLSLVPATGGMEALTQFIIPGAPMPAAFDIVFHLPDCPDIRWELTVPQGLAKAFARGSGERPPADGEYRTVIPPGVHRIRNVKLGSRARIRCRIRVTAAHAPETPCALNILQYFRGVEIGRLTIAIGPRPPREPRRPRDELRRTA